MTANSALTPAPRRWNIIEPLIQIVAALMILLIFGAIYEARRQAQVSAPAIETTVRENGVMIASALGPAIPRKVIPRISIEGHAREGGKETNYGRIVITEDPAGNCTGTAEVNYAADKQQTASNFKDEKKTMQPCSPNAISSLLLRLNPFKTLADGAKNLDQMKILFEAAAKIIAASYGIPY